jgi:hypothetical protein
MIFIIDSKGTTKTVLYEPIYQGSNNANQIVLFAPFPKTNAVTVSYTLANGIQTHPFVMTLCDNIPNVQTEEGTQYNVWSIDIDHPITEYAGHVDVQFIVHSGLKMLATYKSGFEVGSGIIAELPDLPEKDVYDKILGNLSSIDAYSKDARDKAITYIRYIAPDEYLLNNESADVILSAYANYSYEGDFTTEGMTKYIDEDSLKDPYPNASEDLFFTNTINAKLNGFTIDLLAPTDVGIVQAYLFKIKKDVAIKCECSNNGIEYTEVDIKPITKGEFIQIVQFNVNSNTRYIRFTEVTSDSNASRDFAYKGVEIFAPNTNGQFEIARNNGNISTIDTYDAQTLISIVESLKNDAEQAKTEAFDKVEEITSEDNYNKANGFLRLDATGKIPADLIPFDRTIEMFPISSEDELTSLYQAHLGDIAYLTELVDGDKLVTKSWRLFGDYFIKSAWLLQSTTFNSSSIYSEESGHSQDTTKVNGVLVRFGDIAKYKSDTKDGLYVITDYAEEV